MVKFGLDGSMVVNTGSNLAADTHQPSDYFLWLTRNTNKWWGGHTVTLGCRTDNIINWKITFSWYHKESKPFWKTAVYSKWLFFCQNIFPFLCGCVCCRTCEAVWWSLSVVTTTDGKLSLSCVILLKEQKLMIEHKNFSVSKTLH